MMDRIFGDVISTYTRAQAIEDGVLIDVTDVAREAGLNYPTALTQAVWTKFVAVPKGCEGFQDESGRLWDIVYMLRCAIRGVVLADWLDARTLCYKLHVVRTAHDLDRTPPLVTLKATCGPGDTPEPVITILLPSED